MRILGEMLGLENRLLFLSKVFVFLESFVCKCVSERLTGNYHSFKKKRTQNNERDICVRLFAFNFFFLANSSNSVLRAVSRG